MLVLTLKRNESVHIGESTVTLVRGRKCRIGIDAPRDLKVRRAGLDEEPDDHQGTANRLARQLVDLVGQDQAIELIEHRQPTSEAA